MAREKQIMLPSTSLQQARRNQTFGAPEPPPSELRPPTVFRISHGDGNTWLLESTNGEVGGVFASELAALRYARAQSNYCRRVPARIELSADRSSAMTR